MVRRAAVLGSPIAHSLSPVLWRAAFDATGLDWAYDAIDCDERALPALLARMRVSDAWAGASLTMPLKLAAVPLLDELDPVASVVGAVNTVVSRQHELRGYNTDAPGMLAALRAAGVSRPSTAVVLGAGGTARGAMWALAQLGVRSPLVVARDPAAAERLVTLGRTLKITPYAGPWSLASRAAVADLAINTTPAGVADFLAEGEWSADAVLFDVLYHPWPTPLAALAARSGATVVGGLDLLVHQAALAFEVMTSRPAPLALMREAGEGVLRLRDSH